MKTLAFLILLLLADVSRAEWPESLNAPETVKVDRAFRQILVGLRDRLMEKHCPGKTATAVTFEDFSIGSWGSKGGKDWDNVASVVVRFTILWTSPQGKGYTSFVTRYRPFDKDWDGAEVTDSSVPLN